jgi:hypothetical protein
MQFADGQIIGAIHHRSYPFTNIGSWHTVSLSIEEWLPGNSGSVFSKHKGSFVLSQPYIGRKGWRGQAKPQLCGISSWLFSDTTFIFLLCFDNLEVQGIWTRNSLCSNERCPCRRVIQRWIEAISHDCLYSLQFFSLGSLLHLILNLGKAIAGCGVVR